MKTNDLKKGTLIRLRNGWKAKLVDNMHGNIRTAEVYGDFTETGSIYSHNIVGYYKNGKLKKDIQYTPSQVHCYRLTSILGL